MNKKTCAKCHCNCHCEEPLHSHFYDKDLCTCDTCTCKKTIGDFAKANPNKTYRELENMRDEDLSYENNGGIVIDNTGECESCQ